MLLLQKSRAFLLLLTTILLRSINCQKTYYYHFCPGPSNDTATADFNSNLATLLDSLSSKASFHTFYKDTSNGIYNLFNCRGDVSTDNYQLCIMRASREIRGLCPSKSAIVWYEECMLHYSDVNFFGVVQTDPTVFMWNLQNNTSPDDTDFGALGLIDTLIDKAPYYEKKYATHETVRGNGLKSRYGLVQCNRDLNSSACASCLVQFSRIIYHCCHWKIGWRIFSPSCNLRYEEYRFFQQSSALPLAKKIDNVLKIVIITLPSIAAVAAILGLWYYLSAYRKRRDEGTSEEILLGIFKGKNHGLLVEGGMIATDEENSGEMHYISLATIQAATDCFSDANKLGEGGFGLVYKGALANGKEIAVKRLSRTSGQGLTELRNEVTLIARLQHKNLVRLLGFCLEKNEKLLVYEYMPNKSLDVFLFDSSMSVQLNWQRHFSIINGIARGIMYLHEDSRLRIIHRDLKASNVLLDHEMNPKISDFGMARIFCGHQSEANTKRVVGTYFGVLLLEIISGRKNNSFHLSEHGESLLTFAWKLWSKSQGMELMDPLLAQSCVAAEVLKCIHIGLLCVQEDAADRPTMSSVVVMLASETMTLPTLKPPAFSVGRFVHLSAQSTSNDKVCSVNEVTLSNVSPR